MYIFMYIPTVYVLPIQALINVFRACVGLAPEDYMLLEHRVRQSSVQCSSCYCLLLYPTIIYSIIAIQYNILYSHICVYYYIYIIYIQVPSLIRSCQTAATALTNTTTTTTTTTTSDTTTEGETSTNGKKTKLSIPETAATNKARKLTPTIQ